jgi:hypothetical protein
MIWLAVFVEAALGDPLQLGGQDIYSEIVSNG